MTSSPLYATFTSPDQTATFAAELGARLQAGDTLLLEGPIGAGKTHFARSLIQSRQPHHEDVPSPTFTLVQTYDGGACEIWHADLYRLSGPSEVPELGLTDAFETAICLIEWPDRLGEYAPADSLTLRFAAGEAEETRLVELTWNAPIWDARLKGIAHD